MELSFEFANENNAGMLFPGRVFILALPCSPSTPVHVYMDIIFMNVEGLEGWMWPVGGCRSSRCGSTFLYSLLLLYNFA